jgi:hypothetical protein
MIVSGSNELKTATFHVKIVKETYTSEDVQSHSDFAPFAALLQGAGAAASNANTAAAAANAAASLAEQKAQAIPDDYSDLVAEVEEVKADLSESNVLQKLLHDNVPNTVQNYIFIDGTVSKVEHKNGDTVKRSDVFTYGTTSIKEVRTLDSGESLTIVTNLLTLETSVAFAAT